jgi:hypothetical protein
LVGVGGDSVLNDSDGGREGIGIDTICASHDIIRMNIVTVNTCISHSISLCISFCLCLTRLLPVTLVLRLALGLRLLLLLRLGLRLRLSACARPSP